MDAIREWTDAQNRVIELVSAAGAATETQVPACPDWTVRQLLAHMIGLDADSIRGDEPDDHNARWTQAQVDQRAGDDVAALVAEWRAMTGAVQDYMASTSPRPLGDAVIHEQDIRGALHEPGARDTDAIHTLRETFAGRVANAVAAAGLSAIELRGPQWHHTIGEGDIAAVLEADDFDLARAMMSRRSANQLRSWTVRGDIGPFLDCFALLGPLPEQDLTD